MKLLVLWGGVIALLVAAYPFGYLLLNARRQSPSPRGTTLNDLPIHLATGLGVLTVILYVTSLWSLTALSVYTLITGGWLILLYKTRSRLTALSKWLSAPDSTSIRRTVRTDVPLALLVGTAVAALSLLLLTSRVTTPPGDPVSHGIQVSLLLEGRGLHFIGVPLWDTLSSVSAYYPKGFHFLGATVSLTLGLYPAEAVLVAGTAIALLLPLTVFSIVRGRTGNSTLAAVAALGVIMIPGGEIRVANLVLMAYYWNGIYPFLYGILLTAVLFDVVDRELDADQGKGSSLRFLPLGTLVAAILLSYYLFISAVVVLIVAQLLIRVKDKRGRLATLATLLGVAAAIYLLAGGRLREAAKSFVQVPEAGALIRYWLPLTEFSHTLVGLLTLSACFMAVICLWMRWHRGLALGYLFLALPLLASMSSQSLYVELLWFLAPSRMAMLLLVLSTILSAVTIREVWGRRRGVVGDGPISWPPSLGRLLGTMALALMLLLVAFSYSSVPTRNWGYPTGEDYDAILWIQSNVPGEALILNDRSFIGLYLPAFGLKNVVYLRELAFYPSSTSWPGEMLERARALGGVFDDPTNESFIKSAIDRWGISFIHISSERVYYDYWETQRYQSRTTASSTILEAWDENPCLRSVYRGEHAGVYATYLVAADLGC